MARTAAAAGRFADLRQRTLSGVAIGAAAVGLIVAGGWLCAAGVALCGAVAAAEFRRISTGRAGADQALYAGAVAVAVAFAHARGMEAGAALLVVAAVLFAAFDVARGARPIWGLVGFATVGLAAASYAAMRELEPFGLATALWIGGVVVGTDVGAYAAGRAIGGPKLWPAVSPKKTWAGLGGGVALAVAVGAVFSAATRETFVEEVGVVSAIAAVVSQMGDLAESSFKRRFGAKDSSALIPGHGGALDRLDGFCAATLVAAAATYWRGAPVFTW